jgi:putative ABC transport system substrate-binding protein
MPKVGIFHSGSSADKSHVEKVDAFISSLKGVYNAAVTILPTVWAEGDSARLPGLARSLVNDKTVDLVVAAGGTRSAEAAMAEIKTSGKKVVFTSASHTFAHGALPATMTGVCAHTSDLNAARLEKLLVLKPTATHIGVLINSNRNDHNKKPDLDAIETKKKIHLHWEDINGPTTPKQAFDNWKSAKIKIDAALIAADPFFDDTRSEIVTLAGTIPAIYQWREFVEAGGLMSYGLSLRRAYEEAGKIAGNILNTGNISPVWEPQDPTDFELVINSDTASKLPFAVPQSLLDEAELIKSKHKA